MEVFVGAIMWLHVQEAFYVFFGPDLVHNLFFVFSHCSCFLYISFLASNSFTI